MRINIRDQVKVKSSVAARIKKYNLSTWRLAHRLGLSEIDVTSWLNDRDVVGGGVTEDEVLSICNELGISVRLQITIHPITEAIISKYGAKEPRNRGVKKGNDGID